MPSEGVQEKKEIKGTVQTLNIKTFQKILLTFSDTFQKATPKNLYFYDEIFYSTGKRRKVEWQSRGFYETKY